MAMDRLSCEERARRIAINNAKLSELLRTPESPAASPVGLPVAAMHKKANQPVAGTLVRFYF
jgi:hypothetical protein